MNLRKFVTDFSASYRTQIHEKEVKMNFFDWLTMISGLAFFLFGMNFMGETLKKSAGRKLKVILGNLTSNPFKGFLLGLGVTAIIQSSSATTVMIVGFVNSGTMALTEAISVIMGANVGTAVTSWLTALSGIGGASSIGSVMQWFKPSTFTPVLALIGIILYMLGKNDGKKNIGKILMGFAILMVGMQTMSSAVEPLSKNEQFKSILTMFENPLLGVLAGMVLTAVIQSSSASIGILQSFTATGAITFGNAVPIILGQNIGTCITALISSMGTSKNAKRAAAIHLYFNVFGSFFCLIIFYVLRYLFSIPLFEGTIDMWGIASVHTLFNIISVVILAPFSKLLEKLAVASVRDKGQSSKTNYLDERLLETPSVALSRSKETTLIMAQKSYSAFSEACKLINVFNEKSAAHVRELENEVDQYEDSLGTYLVALSDKTDGTAESHEVTKLLHLIGDFERISDHAVNIVESAEELYDKKIVFSQEAKKELGVLFDAVNEITRLSYEAFSENDCNKAMLVEPLEQVIDGLKSEIKSRHIQRLQNSQCTIEHGFVLSDLLTNLERVADHCSNIAGCIIEMSKHDSLGLHSYLKGVKANDTVFAEKFAEYSATFSLDKRLTK